MAERGSWGDLDAAAASLEASFSARIDVNEALIVDAPPEVVWHTIVDADRRRGWWSYLDLDAIAGVRFEEHGRPVMAGTWSPTGPSSRSSPLDG